MNKKKLYRLRKTGIAEGISFLILLFIAMPIKYYFNQPIAVKIVGWLHGILFVAFNSLATDYKFQHNKNIKWLALAFAASLIPAGTFFFDRKLKKEELNF